MFHLYFGLFDVVLYAAGAYFAIVLADAICDDRPTVSASNVSKTSSSVLSGADIMTRVYQPTVKKSVEQQSVSTSL
jgi:hypothetical protein